MYTPSLREENGKAIGFTLLELLIVIGIMVILGTVLVLVLNPAETLKKSRDNQRISDLATLKTALGLYVTDLASPDLDAATNTCLTSTAAAANTAAQISYSNGIDTDPTCNLTLTPGGDAETSGSPDFATDTCRYADTTAAVYTLVDGTGWIPVNLTGISGGTPISNLPVDPTNTMATADGTAPAIGDLVYRYGCQNAITTAGKPAYAFEIDANLESSAYSGRESTDGGDNTALYEVGNSVKILPTQTTGW